MRGGRDVGNPHRHIANSPHPQSWQCWQSYRTTRRPAARHHEPALTVCQPVRGRGAFCAGVMSRHGDRHAKVTNPRLACAYLASVTGPNYASEMSSPSGKCVILPISFGVDLWHDEEDDRRHRITGEVLMDDSRFDALARTLTDPRSRRGALAALLGGTLGLLGLTEVDAKKKKKGKGKKGKGGKGKPPTVACVPDLLSATCAGRCGFWTNNCGQSVGCLACPSGEQCLGNGSCAQTCSSTPGCPSVCSCSRANTEGIRTCYTTLTSGCPTESCQTTADCRPGFHCQACFSATAPTVCVALCSA